MLQAQAVKPGALPVLKRIMNLPELNNFCLVGGTALALKYGHRVSVDLDFFSDENYDTPSIINALEKEFAEKFEAENRNPRWAIFCFINGIKTDIVHYPHKTIQYRSLIL